MKNNIARVGLGIGVLLLVGCANVTYRCPLDNTEKADSPTACASMQEAAKGARLGGGGRNSTLMSDDGSLVKLHGAKSGPAAAPGAKSLAQATAAAIPVGGPFASPTINPAYQPPRVFQVWTDAYQDAEGNLHDGRNSYFTTPGRWGYGDGAAVPVTPSGRPAGATPSNRLMEPARADELPSGRVVDPNAPGRAAKSAQSVVTNMQGASPSIDVRPNTPLQSPSGGDSLNSISKATSAMSKSQPANKAGITPPNLTLN